MKSRLWRTVILVTATAAAAFHRFAAGVSPFTALVQRPIHLSFMAVGIRSVDLIDLDYGPGNSYWHSPEDTIDTILEADLGTAAWLMWAVLEPLAGSAYAIRRGGVKADDTVLIAGKEACRDSGKIMFTKHGFTGPAILGVSRPVSTPLVHSTASRSSSPPVPLGIIGKPSSPIRFCSVLNAAWSVATTCNDPDASPAHKLS